MRPETPTLRLFFTTLKCPALAPQQRDEPPQLQLNASNLFSRSKCLSAGSYLAFLAIWRLTIAR